MAGDWIKVEHATLDKPEIMALARMLGVSHGDALELVLRFWVWIDNNSVDGHVDAVVDADVDKLLHCPGFAHALIYLKWLALDENGFLVIPKFDDHNSESAKKRAEKSKRQQKYRKRVDARVDANVDADVDAPVSTNASTREEKRRVNPIHTAPKANKPTSLPAGFEISERVRTWAAEKGHRRLEDRLEHFVGYAKRSGKKYADWDEAFMSAVREDWAKLNGQDVAPQRADGTFRVAL